MRPEELDDEPLILLVEDKPVAALVSLKNVDPESLAEGRGLGIAEVGVGIRGRSRRRSR